MWGRGDHRYLPGPLEDRGVHPHHQGEPRGRAPCSAPRRSASGRTSSSASSRSWSCASCRRTWRGRPARGPRSLKRQSNELGQVDLNSGHDSLVRHSEANRCKQNERYKRRARQRETNGKIFIQASPPSRAIRLWRPACNPPPYKRRIPAGKQACQRVYLQRAEVLSPLAKAFGGRRPCGTAVCAEAAVPCREASPGLVYLNNRIRMIKSAAAAARARSSSVSFTVTGSLRSIPLTGRAPPAR